jgi:nucleoside phosphorylase
MMELNSRGAKKADKLAGNEKALVASEAKPGIAILTAMGCEYQALELLLEQHNLKPLAADEKNNKFGVLPGFSGAMHSVILPPRSFGQTMTAVQATHILDRFPTVGLVAFVGIAGGTPGKNEAVKPGDVIVCDSVFDLDNVKHLPTGESKRRGAPLSDACVSDRARTMKETEEFKEEWKTQSCILLDAAAPEQAKVWHDWAKDKPPKILVRNIGSTMKNIEDKKVCSEVASPDDDIRALEMEGWGAATAAHQMGRKFCIIRGVSNVVGEPRDDAVMQPYAARSATALFAALLRSFAPEEFFVPQPKPTHSYIDDIEYNVKNAFSRSAKLQVQAEDRVEAINANSHVDEFILRYMAKILDKEIRVIRTFDPDIISLDDMLSHIEHSWKHMVAGRYDIVFNRVRNIGVVMVDSQIASVFIYVREQGFPCLYFETHNADRIQTLARELIRESQGKALNTDLQPANPKIPARFPTPYFEREYDRARVRKWLLSLTPSWGKLRT